MKNIVITLFELLFFVSLVVMGCSNINISNTDDIEFGQAIKPVIEAYGEPDWIGLMNNVEFRYDDGRYFMFKKDNDGWHLESFGVFNEPTKDLENYRSIIKEMLDEKKNSLDE